MVNIYHLPNTINKCSSDSRISIVKLSSPSSSSSSFSLSFQYHYFIIFITVIFIIVINISSSRNVIIIIIKISIVVIMSGIVIINITVSIVEGNFIINRWNINNFSFVGRVMTNSVVKSEVDSSNGLRKKGRGSLIYQCVGCGRHSRKCESLHSGRFLINVIRYVSRWQLSWSDRNTRGLFLAYHPSLYTVKSLI